MGKRYFEDILETMGVYIDSLKFAGGSFALMPPAVVKNIINLAHQYNVQVSTGGLIEYVLTQGSAAVEAYFGNARDLVLMSSNFPPVSSLSPLTIGCDW